MVLSDYSKLWILSLHWRGYKVSTIVNHLCWKTESEHQSKEFVNSWNATATVGPLPESQAPDSPENFHQAFKEELVAGINQFWATVDTRKCCRYIEHLCMYKLYQALPMLVVFLCVFTMHLMYVTSKGRELLRSMLCLSQTLKLKFT